MTNETYPTIVHTAGPTHGPIINEKGYVDHAIVLIGVNLPGTVVQGLLDVFTDIIKDAVAYTEREYELVSNAHLKSEDVFLREIKAAANNSMRLALHMSEAALLEMAKTCPTPAIDQLAANCKCAAASLAKDR